MLYAIIFSAALGSAEFKPKVSLGPFDTVGLCAAIAAIALGDPQRGLLMKFPNMDFRASCVPHKEIERREGEVLYDLQQLVALMEGRDVQN